MKVKIMPVLAITSLASASFYLLFMLFYNPVHFFYPLQDDTQITPWLRSHLSPGEGIEVYFMFLGMVVYLGLIFLLLKKAIWFSNQWIQAISLVPLILIIIRTRSEIFSFSPNIGLNFVLIIVPLSLLYISYLYFKFMKSNKINTLVFALLWVTFAGLVFLSQDLAAPFSYSFIVAPALKLLQGESLKSFQISYGMPLTLLFALMLKLKLQLTQMHLVFGAIFIIWYVAYFYLASKVIKDKFLLFLFMLALVMFRLFAIRHDPTAIVEVTPLRLELWVPLLIIVHRFGLLSLVTSSSFALVYFLDNFFGALYLGVYLVAVFLIKSPGVKLIHLPGVLLLFTPVILSLFLRFQLFGSLFSEQGQLYQHLRLYFQPISNRSIFWVILPLYGLFLSLIAKEKEESTKYLLLLLLGLGVVQLLYFFGPSLDHNLLNISGIFILILFIALYKLSKHSFSSSKNYLSKKTVYILASLLILFSSISFTRFLLHKLDQVRLKITTGEIIQKHFLDTWIDKSPDLFDRGKGKIFLISSVDGYYNYRYNLPQVGFYTPFHANIFVEQTAENLLELKNKGYRLILWEKVILDSLKDFNQSPILRSKNLQFVAIDNGEYLEVNLVKDTNFSGELIITRGWINYLSKQGFKLSYPPKWRVEDVSKGVLLTDRLDKFRMLIEKEGSKFKVLVDPVNSDKMIQFESIIRSLKE